MWGIISQAVIGGMTIHSRIQYSMTNSCSSTESWQGDYDVKSTVDLTEPVRWLGRVHLPINL